jgi:hypothetical protein
MKLEWSLQYLQEPATGPWDPVLRPMTPIHILTPCFYLNMSSSLSTGLLPSGFSTEIF